MLEDILVAFLPFMFMFCLINIIKTANVHLYEKDAKFRQLLLLNLYALNTNITLMDGGLAQFLIYITIMRYSLNHSNNKTTEQ